MKYDEIPAVIEAKLELVAAVWMLVKLVTYIIVPLLCLYLVKLVFAD